MSRATELDSSWAKGYSRLAEVYNAQAQYGKALEAYERAISLSSGPDKTRYEGLHAKMLVKTRDVFYINGANYDPARNGNDAMFARFEEAVPDRGKFGMDDKNLTPLGYMTAAHKLYSGYTRTVTTCG
jgi:tetratricopeptide (TPR) repeat protein